ncbi:MAG: helix-turn-helix domain-containing protein [Planctomycetaceae bacterium]|nr:helix-turn-helix domain-containing protein [Planctomycetaceae bacterium]
MGTRFNEDSDERTGPRLLSVAQAARFLGCSEANVYALLETGELAYVPIGRRKGYRIDILDLESFIEGRKKKQAAAPVKVPRPRLKHIRLS